jgi:hypothetical protein
VTVTQAQYDRSGQALLIANPAAARAILMVRTIGMAARFDQVAEVTLDELRIELFYPFDAAAERFFRASASRPVIRRSPARVEPPAVPHRSGPR